MKALRSYNISPRLPDELSPLHDIAMNLGWLSDARVQSLFSRLHPQGTEGQTLDPIGTLTSAPQKLLQELAADPVYVGHAAELRDSLERSLAMPRWFQLEHVGELRSVAYFSAEFGIAKALPQYSGGLGILAGDHLKAANELGVPLVAIGLKYRHGYFSQRLDASGWQTEHFPDLDPATMALREIPGVRIMVRIGDLSVAVRAWEARVGRVPLYLLDTDVEENLPSDRLITDRLYGGDHEQRVRQELVLGIGGVRLLSELGYDPQVFHMNEGHAVFSALERIAHTMESEEIEFDAALQSIRPSTLFTTHTPVPAGIDRFDRRLIEKYFAHWCDRLGISLDDLMALGHEPGTVEGEAMNMACLGMRVAEASNGVAKLHGDVSREMFHSLWPEVERDEVPIGSVTNGVNAHTWVMREMDNLFERYVGHDWTQAEPARWAEIDNVTDEHLRAIRSTGRARLVDFARQRVRSSLLEKGVSETEAEWANEILDPDILTIGFARRFATYKRADLLLQNENRLRDLLRDVDRPVQFVFAGKAHPADEPGKKILQRVAQFALDARNRHRFVYLEDYDIEVGRFLYQGVDVWLNTPRRPMEACGTSGMKVVYNGGLNLSILDGWWAEMYAHDLGFAIPSAWWMDDSTERDEQESRTVFRILEDQVVPTFYDAEHKALPAKWLKMMRNSIIRLGPQVESNRMLRDYVDDFYEPLAARTEQFRRDMPSVATDLSEWKKHMRAHFETVSIVEVDDSADDVVAGARSLRVLVDCGRIEHADLDVQVLFGAIDVDGELITPQARSMRLDPEPDHEPGDPYRYEATIHSDTSGPHGLAVRVIPRHRELGQFSDIQLVCWAK